ncbi:MAG: SbcC/MukB-like Walker B domain-containing protein, partial [Eubacterium sp.]
EKAGLLKAKSQEMATLGRQRERGRAALDIRPLEKRYQEETHRHQQVKAELTQQEKAIQAQVQIQKGLAAQVAQVEDPAYRRESEEMETQARRLGELSRRLGEFEDLSLRHKERQEAMEALQKRQEALAARVKEKALLEEALSGDRKALLKGQGDQVDTRDEGTTLTTRIDGLAAIQEALEKMNASRRALKEMDRERLQVKQELKQWEQERDRIERIQQESAAGELAKHLQDGAPCPVCGAVHHPNPAIPLEALATTEDLKKAREACSRLSGRLAAMAEQNTFHTREKQAKRGEIEGQLTALNREPQLPDPIVLNQEIETLKKTRDQLRERYKDEEGRLKVLRQDIQTKEEQLKGLETALSQGQSLEAAYEEAKTALNESNGILQSKWREIEDQARDLGMSLLPGGGKGQIEDVLQRGKTLEEGVQRRQRKAEGILTELTQCRETLGGLEGTRQSLEKQTEEARTQRDTREKAFIDALDAAGFTRIDYQAYHRLKSEDLDAMAETLAAYDQCCATNTALLKGFEEELAGKTPVDLQVLQGEKVAIEEALGGLRESIGQITQRRRVNEVQVQRLGHLEAERRQVRHQLEILTELGDTIKGKVSGKPKIKLENYILSAYLSDILEAANGFLEESSNGRYHLMIAGNHGDKSSHGLEIEVDDAYTGKARSAASLSGGETFVAALSMALGLSDIIQSTAGGISLETIFIDEGFATLDKDALDKAMNCLARIRTTGRTVGIISHVEELKERVDAQVIVEKTEAGSRLHLI